MNPTQTNMVTENTAPTPAYDPTTSLPFTAAYLQLAFISISFSTAALSRLMTGQPLANPPLLSSVFIVLSYWFSGK